MERGVAEEALRPEDGAGRTRRWREYCCESFCDTAAWMYSGVERHEEFTLGGPLAARAASLVRGRLWSKRTLSI